jgi:RimJ/RimL family protein N-acetyltransferase
MMSLHEAEEEIFADNDRARAALEKLGLQFLNESDARSVLERRVDLG